MLTLREEEKSEKPRDKSADSTRSSGAEIARKPGKVVLCLYIAAARRHYLWAIPGRDVNRTIQLSVTGQSLKWLTCWPLVVNPCRCDSWTQKSFCVLSFCRHQFSAFMTFPEFQRTVFNQGRDEMQRQGRNSQKTIVQPWGRVLGRSRWCQQ